MSPWGEKTVRHPTLINTAQQMLKYSLDYTVFVDYIVSCNKFINKIDIFLNI